jgi:N-acetylmuramoyl-L-alanine amidase
MRYLLATAAAIIFFGLPWATFTFPGATQSFLSLFGPGGDELANIILSHNPKTVAQIQARYAAATPQSEKKVRILVVAGHEPGQGGAEFKSLKERDMTVELANDLRSYLASNPKYEVFTVRDQNDWNPTFSAYFKNSWDDIIAWQKASHQEMSHLIDIGSTTAEQPKVIHNDAPKDIAYRIYGIMKWAKENDMDIVIHVHFNNDAVHTYNVAGKYSGFAIYVPAMQYYNSTTTKAIAGRIFDRMKLVEPVSNFPGEASGIVDEPDLIAIGANNTADAASMLVEYGYIYEPQFLDRTKIHGAIQSMAFETYLGLQDFFQRDN